MLFFCLWSLQPCRDAVLLSESTREQKELHLKLRNCTQAIVEESAGSPGRAAAVLNTKQWACKWRPAGSYKPAKLSDLVDCLDCLASTTNSNPHTEETQLIIQLRHLNQHSAFGFCLQLHMAPRHFYKATALPCDSGGRALLLGRCMLRRRCWAQHVAIWE